MKFSYNTLMDGYCLQGQMELAVKLIYSMASWGGLAHDVYSYSMLINGYCKFKRMDEAMRLFEDMRCKGLSPTIVTYTTLLR